MKIDIVIVNWNSNNQLQDCIDSIRQFHGNLVHSVVVVDNASTDHSLLSIDIRSGDDFNLVIIRNSDNLGFAKACNQGASVCKGEYLLFLNPDTRIFQGSLSGTIEFMDSQCNYKVGICGIRLVDENGNYSISAARFPSLKVLLGKSLGLSAIMPNLFPPHFYDPSELTESMFVDQIIGAFFLVRKHVFNICGGFDENFYVYFEEVDFSLRANKLGFTSYYLSHLSAFHRGGGCSENVKSTRLFYSLRSRIIYARKHYSISGFLGLMLLTAIEFPLRVFRSVIHGSLLDALNTLSAYWRLVSYFIGRQM